MTMSTQYDLNIPRNIPGARAVQAKAHPVPWETGHNYRTGPQVGIQGKSKSGSPIRLIEKDPFFGNGACDTLIRFRGVNSSTSYK